MSHEGEGQNDTYTFEHSRALEDNRKCVWWFSSHLLFLPVARHLCARWNGLFVRLQSCFRVSHSAKHLVGTESERRMWCGVMCKSMWCITSFVCGAPFTHQQQDCGSGPNDAACLFADVYGTNAQVTKAVDLALSCAFFCRSVELQRHTAFKKK